MATPDWVRKVIKRDYARATKAGRLADRTEPRAANARYLARQQSLQIDLTNGAMLRVPVKLIKELKQASPRDIREVEVLGGGEGLHWERLDVDISVPGLLSSIFEGLSSWMSELGRVGGRQSSAAKAAAARKNGRKGGRPRGSTALTR